MADIFGDALAQATDGPGTAGTTVHTQVTEAAAITALADQAWMVGMPQPETGIGLRRGGDVGSPGLEAL